MGICLYKQSITYFDNDDINDFVFLLGARTANNLIVFLNIDLSIY